MDTASIDSTRDDHRAAVRFDSTMPVQIAGQPGQTQNISATGVYFESATRAEIGSLVNFTLEYRMGGELQRIVCEGRVVRVDDRDGRIGIAARMAAPFFETTEVVEAPLLRTRRG